MKMAAMGRVEAMVDWNGGPSAFVDGSWKGITAARAPASALSTGETTGRAAYPGQAAACPWIWTPWLPRICATSIVKVRGWK